MNLGTENRKKTITAAALGMVALICLGYILYTIFGGDSAPTPPSSVVAVNKPALGAPLGAAAAPQPSSSAGAGSRPAATPTGSAAGVAAQVMATASASLDPTLDQSAMLRTEHLVYSGSGRNIFSGTYTAPPPVIEKVKAPIRVQPPVVIQPPVKTEPITCPPTCPPIPLKFFGTETKTDGKRQAFLLQGDDVFLAGVGDIIARRYKIVAVNPNTVQIEDLGNNNTQTLPLQSN